MSEFCDKRQLPYLQGRRPSVKMLGKRIVTRMLPGCRAFSGGIPGELQTYGDTPAMPAGTFPMLRIMGDNGVSICISLKY